MSTEKEDTGQVEHKIHKTHFPVIKVPLADTSFDTGYEWVRSNDGHWKRLPKETDVDGDSYSKLVI